MDCEHFFDGYKANPKYALEFVQTALAAGARWVVLCDTNGGTMPSEVDAIVNAVTKVAPGDRLGIHAHDDTGSRPNSLPQSMTAVRQSGHAHASASVRNANLVIHSDVLMKRSSRPLRAGVTPALTRLTQGHRLRRL